MSLRSTINRDVVFLKYWGDAFVQQRCIMIHRRGQISDCEVKSQETNAAETNILLCTVKINLEIRFRISRSSCYRGTLRFKAGAAYEYWSMAFSTNEIQQLQGTHICNECLQMQRYSWRMHFQLLVMARVRLEYLDRRLQKSKRGLHDIPPMMQVDTCTKSSQDGFKTPLLSCSWTGKSIKFSMFSDFALNWDVANILPASVIATWSHKKIYMTVHEAFHEQWGISSMHPLQKSKYLQCCKSLQRSKVPIYSMNIPSSLLSSNYWITYKTLSHTR